MKYTGFAALLALGLAACGGGGGGDRAALVSICVEDGTSQEACECMADTAREELSDDVYAAVVQAAKDGADNAEDALNDLTPVQQGEFMGFAMKAAMSCGMMDAG